MTDKPNNTMIAYGGSIKALSKGRVGGYLVRYTDPEHLDLTGDFFTADTDYGSHTKTAVYYQHGYDGHLALKRLSEDVDIVDDEFGKWVEAQLNLRDKYERYIYEQADRGKMGWSSATASHLSRRRRRGKGYWIESWPLGLDASITPVPTDSQNTVVTYKSYMKSLSQALGLWIANAETEPEAAKAAASVAGRRKYFIIGAS